MRTITRRDVVTTFLYVGVLISLAIQLGLVPYDLIGLPARVRTPHPDISSLLDIATPILAVIAATLITLMVFRGRSKYSLALALILILTVAQLALPVKALVGNVGLHLEDEGVLLGPDKVHRVGEHLVVVFIFPEDGLLSKEGLGLDVNYCPSR